MMMEVTTIYLEISSPADLKPRHSADSRFAVREAIVAQWQLNRFLYLHVGGPWGWTDKFEWPDQRWQVYVSSPALRTFLGFYEGSIAGYYELHRKNGDVEIAHFGLTPGVYRPRFRWATPHQRDRGSVALGCFARLGSHLHLGSPGRPAEL